MEKMKRRTITYLVTSREITLALITYHMNCALALVVYIIAVHYSTPGAPRLYGEYFSLLLLQILFLGCSNQ